MPRLTQSVPKYRKHKQSGQAIVSLCGRDHLLGPHGTKGSKLEYDRLITEWLTNGRRPAISNVEGISIVEGVARYWKHAKSYYVKNGQPTDEQAGIRCALRFVNQLYSDTTAEDFAPLALKVVREKMVEAGLARSTINQHVGRIRRMFKWLSAEQLIPTSTWQSLVAVDGLRKGRTTAREPEPVRPVGDAVVDATLPYLPEVVADIIRVQRLTGMRPGEVCSMRPCDIDRSGEVWLYTPREHKTQHHDCQRVIAIGPKAQAILLRYLARDSQAYCFAPRDSEAKRRAAAHANRRTPLSSGDRPGTNRIGRKARRFAGEKYDASSLRHAIARACDRAFPAPPEIAQDPDKLRAWQKSRRWSANRLRHSCATAVRREFGVEAAQHLLGHTTTAMTEVYAERNIETAARVAKAIG